MLKHILISKVRIKLLEQFFLHPLDQYHVRGLVRILDEEINAIRRELLNLADAGILKSEKQGNKIVYVVNYHNAIVGDLRDLIMKSSELGKRIHKVAREVGKVDCVIASLAFLNGEYKDENDVDFLFVGDVDVNKLNAGMKDVEQLLNKELRIAALSTQDFEFGKKKRTPVIMNAISNDFIVVFGSLKYLIM